MWKNMIKICKTLVIDTWINKKRKMIYSQNSDPHLILSRRSSEEIENKEDDSGDLDSA